MSNTKYIVVEGPIGVGKTSLVHMLADRFSARTILERYEKNPFLEDFYADRARYAFQTQMFFLLHRYQQQEELARLNQKMSMVVSDYFFGKDNIFAKLNLDEEEFALYDQYFRMMSKDVLSPDLVIFLQADIDILMHRLASQGHKHEEGITREYLEELIGAYNDFFFYYNEAPLLIINTSEIDFVNRPGDFEALVGEILHTRKGTQYFSPLASKDG